MTAGEAELVATWQYDGDWSIYNLDSAESILDDLACYHSVLEHARVLGFCCTGVAARVPGMTEEPGILDVGLGMDPALVGQGHGAAFGAAVLRYLAAQDPDQTLRAVIQDWNVRSLRLTRRLGFSDVGQLVVHLSDQPVTYRVLTRPPG
ncbi:GNAT family protein [Mycobacterium sp. RTGN5]|uniref:GNAT family N-acetyltransferase n=1 Tax=Mycobacterium sp. RTGN5 TaxID=3016522 RepID=UPI0029C980B3|nr:GNAT family protein [Mycobacterium sp. RTGN5]